MMMTMIGEFGRYICCDYAAHFGHDARPCAVRLVPTSSLSVPHIVDRIAERGRERDLALSAGARWRAPCRSKTVADIPQLEFTRATSAPSIAPQESACRKESGVCLALADSGPGNSRPLGQHRTSQSKSVDDERRMIPVREGADALSDRVTRADLAAAISKVSAGHQVARA